MYIGYADKRIHDYECVYIDWFLEYTMWEYNTCVISILLPLFFPPSPSFLPFLLKDIFFTSDGSCVSSHSASYYNCFIIVGSQPYPFTGPGRREEGRGGQ